jgi:hypothetical protein
MDENENNNRIETEVFQLTQEALKLAAAAVHFGKVGLT